MSNTKLFRTYIVTWPSQASQIDGIGVDGEWCLRVRDDPSYRHWTDEDEGSRGTLHGEITNARIRKQATYQIRCKELLIETIDEDTATNIASLIQIGTLLGYPDVFNGPKYFGTNEVLQQIENFMFENPFASRFTFQENALYGCNVAITSWAKRSLKYAIEKYKLSLELDSFTPHSASPRYGRVFAIQHPEYSHHVKAATAVLVAFSVVEELGLEIRSSSKNKRFKDNQKGEWNPDVKAEAEHRLKEAGVDISELVRWIYRGDPSPLELEVKPQLGAMVEDADGIVVRDLEMEVVDALHKASYIRNFVAAHKYSELVSLIGPYDVHNVQLLARRLILSSLKLYKVF